MNTEKRQAETTTTTTATARTKSQLRYAIKTKVFHENRQDLLKRCLELASEWSGF